MYAEWISGSAANDHIRWDTPNPCRNADNYQTWENNVRYLQYFCLNRLRCLCAQYGIDYTPSLWKPTEEVHTVSFFVDGDMVYSMPVLDGESINIKEIEQLKDYTESNWLVSFKTRKYFYSEYLPILEDCSLFLDNGYG